MSYPPEFLRHRERIRAWALGREYYKAVEALEFAAQFHTGTRKDGITSEFHHQISIAHYIRTLRGVRHQEDVISCAFLHDVVEDYDVSPEEIEARFGRNICDTVVLLSRKFRGVEKTYEEYYRPMASSAIASIVKGGDRVHNFQTMGSVFTCKKQIRYIKECEEYILPMLKAARNNFPDQELAYENIKHALKGQIELLRLSIEAKIKIEELQEVINGKSKVTKGCSCILSKRKSSAEVSSSVK